jgi:phage/plasmid primase-like uncharacterized protein
MQNLGELSDRFANVCRSYGLIVSAIKPGKWVSVPTEDHPHKKNGRYKFMGDIGWIQNWATMEKPVSWIGEKANRIYVSPAVQHQDENDAARKAAWILEQTKPDTHPYLKKKGFEKQVGNVWDKDGIRLLVIPMRINNRLVGCQLIDEGGGKKFLKGQKTKGAFFSLGTEGIPIFVEGYATGLSVHAALTAAHLRHNVFVCFSASNMEFVSRSSKVGVIIADHDANGIGEKVAVNANKSYWISPTVGEDFNDFHLRHGLFNASQSLKRIVLPSISKMSAQSAESAQLKDYF